MPILKFRIFGCLLMYFTCLLHVLTCFEVVIVSEQIAWSLMGVVMLKLVCVYFQMACLCCHHSLNTARDIEICCETLRDIERQDTAVWHYGLKLL